MPGQGKKNTQNLNSALNLWQEAVEKASVDLEKIVKNSIQRLTAHGKQVESALDEQLTRLADQTAITIDANTEELSGHKEQLESDISEFEREKIEMMLTAAHESRAKVDRLVRETKREILDQFNHKLEELTELLADPKKHFEGFEEEKKEIISEVSQVAKEKTVAKEDESKEAITDKNDELSNLVDEKVEETKQGISNKLEEYSNSFDKKIELVLSRLDEVYESTKAACEETAGKGRDSLEKSLTEETDFLTKKVEAWKDSVANLKDNFENEIESKTTEHFKNHINRLEYRVSEAKATMNHISGDANTRVSQIHKSYYSSLKRLERKYQEKIQSQLTRIEEVIKSESTLPQSNKAQADRIREDLQKKLDSQIKVRGNELIKSIKKQVAQMEADFKRQNMSSSEQIDGIRLSAVESLEKQVKIIRTELDRIDKSFQSELSHLATELPEIEERGHVAAMSVNAYQASMLTLESD